MSHESGTVPVRLRPDQLVGATFSFQNHRFDHVLDTISGFGLDRIELWGIAQHLDLFTETPDRVAAVRRALRDRGISVVCFTPEQVVYPVNIASGDAALRADSLRRFRRAVDICVELGSPQVFLTAGRGYEDEPREAAWERSVQSLREIARHAGSAGVTCLLEPLQRVESNLVLDVADLRRMVDDIGEDNVGVVLDTVAMACAGDTVRDYVDAFGPRLRHVQLVDGNPAGHLVWGEGSLPLGDHLLELGALGYQGTITFEPFGDGSYSLDPEAAWRTCVERFRACLRDGVAR
jgi:protein FrlC